MKKSIFVKNLLAFGVVMFSLQGCDDLVGALTGEDVSADYRSCRIRNSGALFLKDRQTDHNQCWGFRISGKNEAMTRCQSLIDAYMSRRYLTGNQGGNSVISPSKCN